MSVPVVQKVRVGGDVEYVLDGEDGVDGDIDVCWRLGEAAVHSVII